MRELSQQIDSHVVVINEENLTIAIAIEMQGTPQSTPSLVPSVAREAPTTTSIVPWELTIWLVEPFSTFL